MKVGHIYIDDTTSSERNKFVEFVEALDRLALPQFVLLRDDAAARRLLACPYVTVGPIVRSPVVANCYLHDIDVVHAYGDRSGQAGLLLMLTRSIPFVFTRGLDSKRHPLRKAVLLRASRVIRWSDLEPENVIRIYRHASEGRSELPENADGR